MAHTGRDARPWDATPWEPGTVDFFASEVHYVDHLAPIWWALPAELRGRFCAAGHVAGRLRGYGIDPARGRPRGLVVVASHGDLRRTTGPVILVEHGAGQHYGGTEHVEQHGAYAGGSGRDRVVLFVVPNADVAARNRAAYPATPNVVAGCPKLDRWRVREPTVHRPAGDPVPAVAHHWDCSLIPEARSAWAHYRPAWAWLAAAFPVALGHSHPRAFRDLAPKMIRCGLHPVPDFDQVLATADVYAIDNSSTLYEAAACGLPVVILNAPWYRRDVHHGLRFWRHLPGRMVDDPEDVVAAVEAAAADTAEAAEHRFTVSEAVYGPADGLAADRAAQAIADVAGGRPVPCTS